MLVVSHLVYSSTVKIEAVNYTETPVNFYWLAYSLTLKMEAESSSETLVGFCRITRHWINNLYCQNVKCSKSITEFNPYLPLLSGVRLSSLAWSWTSLLTSFMRDTDFPSSNSHRPINNTCLAHYIYMTSGYWSLLSLEKTPWFNTM
jgi:hypothetical protein